MGKSNSMPSAGGFFGSALNPLPGASVIADSLKGPKPPDPVATANAQTESNKATAVANAELNRVDQYGPLGSSTYKIIGKNADGTPQYSQTTEMSEPIQGLFNSQVANQQQQQSIGSQLLGNVASQYSRPIDTSGVNALQTTAGDAAQAGTGNFVTNVGNGGGDIQRSLGGWGDIPNVIKGAQAAAYNNQMAYLTPQFGNDTSDMQSKLAAQGITQNSAAWNRADAEMGRNHTFQQQQAQNAAFGQGIQAGNTAFGMNLQAGQFTNQAQQQGFDQAISNAGLANHAADEVTAANLANAQMRTQQSQFDASLNNQAHAQDMTDTFAKYNQPLNTFNQLQSGAQAQQPSFNSIPTVGMAPTDTAGIINNSYANQVGQSNGQMQGIGSIAATAAMFF